VNHFYLFPTFLLENNLNGGLTDYLENMNYIFEYGETRHPEYERLYRWGLHEPIKESHIDISSDSTIIDAPTKQSSTKLILTGKKIKKGEIITVSDNDTDSLETGISPEVSILESSTETILPSTNVPDEEVDDSSSIPVSNVDGNKSSIIEHEALDIQSKMLNMLLPNVMRIFKDTTYHNDIKYEAIKVMKSFMNSNLGIIKNNNLLNPISEYIIELTQQQDEPPPNTNKKSPKKTKSPNKK
jgi:hypothetical protein